MKRSLAVALMMIMLAAAAFAGEGSFQRTFQVSGPVDLDVATRSGNITVRSGGAGTMSINAHIRSSEGWFGGGDDSAIQRIEQNPPVSRSGNSVRIDNVPEDLHLTISYEITTPADTKLHARSGSGAVSASSLNGALEAKSGSGNVQLENIRGDVNAQTGSGSINADGVSGALNAHTGSGSVRVRLNEGGDASVSTGSGSIHLEGVNGRVEAKTGSGSIEVAGTQKGDWRFSTGSGSVRLHLAGTSGFDIDAHTSSGRVYTNREVAIQGDLTQRGKTVVGKVNGGGPLLHVRTGSGNINID
jgi:Putative adhesin